MLKNTSNKLSILAISLILAACSNGEKATDNKQNAPATTPTAASNAGEQIVKIGQAGPLSGGTSNVGKDVDNGAKMAIDEINAEGKLTINGQKIKLELQSEDDAGDPRQGVTVAQKLVDSKVVAVVGHVNSGVSIPASSIYAAAGLVQISPASTNPEYTLKANKTPKGNVSAYRIVATDNKQGPALVKYLKGVGAKNIAVLDDSTQFGKGIADQVEKGAKENGIAITNREATTDKTTDFKAVLTKIKAQNPDYIFWGGTGDTAGPLAKQLKELGLTAKIIGPDGICTDTFIKLAGDAAEGTICSQAGVPANKLSKGADFAKRYEAKYSGQKVEIYAPYAYDAIYAIVKAMQKANSTDSEAIAAALPSVSFDGYIGKVAFDKDGELKNAAVSILQVKNKKFEIVNTVF